MREMVQCMSAFLEADAVEAVALVASDATVFMSGFSVDADHMIELTGSARHIFRQTRPSPSLLDLSFEHGRVLVVPVGGTLVWLKTSPEADAGRLLVDVDTGLHRVAELDLCQSGGPDLIPLSRPAVAPETPVPSLSPVPSSPPSAELPSTPTLAGVDACVATFEAVVASAKETLGGPVVRNYLTKTMKGLPLLAGVSVDLEGAIDWDEVSLTRAEIPAALGQWLQLFLARSATVLPELAHLDVRGLAPEGATLDTAFTNALAN